MMRGRPIRGALFEDRSPEHDLQRRMNATTVALADHKELKPHYSDIGRPAIDPELMIRTLIVGYCQGIRIPPPRAALHEFRQRLGLVPNFF